MKEEESGRKFVEHLFIKSYRHIRVLTNVIDVLLHIYILGLDEVNISN